MDFKLILDSEKLPIRVNLLSKLLGIRVQVYVLKIVFIHL